MNLSIEQKLEYFGELLNCGQDIYLWHYDPELKFLRSSCQEAEALQYFFQISSCRSYLDAYKNQPELPPLFLSDEFGLSWIAAFEVSAQQLCRIYLIGPTFTSDISSQKIRQTLDRHAFSPQLDRKIMNQLSQIPITPLTSWLQYGIMLHYTVTGERLEISDLSYQNTPNVSGQTDSSRNPNANAPKQGTWLAENKVLQMIEEGNTSYQDAFGRMSMSIDFAQSSASSVDSMRYYKNSVISFITLATRAAIRGGLDPETAYLIGNHYIESVEGVNSVSELLEINKTMFEDFIKRVQKVKLASDLSPAVIACCNYISLHIKEKISLSDLAATVGYDDRYLAQKFKREMHKTISQYIKEQRILQSQNLLLHSHFSVAEISDQLGFCNASYFIETFRKINQCTPSEYRMRHS